MGLSDRTKKIAMVISLKDYDHGELLEFGIKLRGYLNGISPPVWAYALHDMDITGDGDMKTPHYHLYVEMPKVARLGTILNYFAKGLNISPFAISIEKAASMEGCIQYLVHKNAPDKHQYERWVIHSNIPDEEIDSILERPCEAFNVDYIFYAWECSEHNRYKFIKMIGLERYRLYRNVINDIIN